MKTKNFNSSRSLDLVRLQEFLSVDSNHPHIHQVDMPYRLTATWQDFGGELAVWEDGDRLMAWAVFQPAWWNLDVAVHPSKRGSDLEKEVIEWGVAQMKSYSRQSGESFWGSVEFFESDPHALQTAGLLASLGFEPFEWSTVRLGLDLTAGTEPPAPELPKGFSVRPLNGQAEVGAYVDLHRAAFGSDKMTAEWRSRTLTHSAYKPEIDLVVVDENDRPVGFCVCWLWNDIGQIEPLGVHPDFQGMGLGRALELSAIAILYQNGAQTALVDHTSFNETAISLSMQNGFKQIDNALRYYVDIGGD